MAENLVTMGLAIVGTRPLLWNRLSAEIFSSKRREKTGSAGNNPDEWKATHRATDEGQLYLETSQVFGCAREGAKYTKRGRTSISRFVVATLQVVEEKILINRFMPDELLKDSNQPVYLDVRPVKNPNSRGMNIRYRVAASAGWEAIFRVFFDKTIVSRQEMHAVFIDAGKLCGLGDGRAIGFGRFDVKEVVEIAEEQAAV